MAKMNFSKTSGPVFTKKKKRFWSRNTSLDVNSQTENHSVSDRLPEASKLHSLGPGVAGWSGGPTRDRQQLCGDWRKGASFPIVEGRKQRKESYGGRSYSGKQETKNRVGNISPLPGVYYGSITPGMRKARNLLAPQEYACENGVTTAERWQVVEKSVAA